jgi:hypothetical protein
LEEPTVEIRMATLIESIRSLSQITANHDVLLTKLIDDHEQRIRLLEKCALATTVIEHMEKRVRELENWRWYVIGIAVGLSTVIAFMAGKL